MSFEAFGLSGDESGAAHPGAALALEADSCAAPAHLALASPGALEAAVIPYRGLRSCIVSDNATRLAQELAGKRCYADNGERADVTSLGSYGCVDVARGITGEQTLALRLK